MKKLITIFWLMFFCLPIYAQDLGEYLNKITLTLNAETWLTTQTVLVNVSVNAAVTDFGLEQIQADVMQKLKKLSAKGEWHMTSFNRQQDKSGLESVQIYAEARLPQTEIANLRTMAKNLSKPGITFSIDNVLFTPSDEEVKAANKTLRMNIYLQAKAELDEINKTYPDQKYYIHVVNFNESPPVPQPMVAYNLKVAGAVGSEGPASVPVGNKLQLQASVIISSYPEQILAARPNIG